VSLLGIITGMKSEAACITAGAIPAGDEAGDLSIAVHSVGGDARRTKAMVRQLADEGCAGLISFGIAAGIDRILKPGQLVIAATVELPTGDLLPVNKEWRRELCRQLKAAEIPYVQGPLVGVDAVVASPEEKMRLHASTAAIVADMESHIVAYEARAANIPFIAIRAVADPYSRTVPAIAMDALAPDGSARTGMVMSRLLYSPQSLPGLIHIALDSGKALSVLKKVAASDGGRFGFRG
jgi:adenosylhomocysteine nucleosidase